MGWLAVVAGGLVVAGLWLCAGTFRASGLTGKAQRLLVGVALLVIGVLGGTLVIVLRGFQAFVNPTLVAHVTCRWVAPGEFELEYERMLPVSQPPLRTRLRGDQWAISGGVVKWHPWVTALGIPSYHKPTRLSGRFADVAKERASSPSAAPLNGGEDWVWEWFYRLDPYLPFVDAVYGSAAYAYVDPKSRFDVYVSPSGYLIKRRPLQQPRR